MCVPLYENPTMGCGTYDSSKEAVSSDVRLSDSAAMAIVEMMVLSCTDDRRVTNGFWSTQANATGLAIRRALRNLRNPFDYPPNLRPESFA